MHNKVTAYVTHIFPNNIPKRVYNTGNQVLDKFLNLQNFKRVTNLFENFNEYETPAISYAKSHGAVGHTITFS